MQCRQCESCARGGIAFGLGALVLAGVLITRADAPSAQQSAAPKTYTVRIEGMRFNPPALTVQRGNRVVWVNEDLVPHTVTADRKAFDSRSISPNSSWSWIARKPGDYDYGCTFHPTMKGRITVK